MGLLFKISLCLLWSLIKAHETGNKPDIPYDWIWSDDADPLDNYRGTNETCWERCFQIKDVKDVEQYRLVYKDLYLMGMKARNLKNRYGVNGTAILIDSNLASYHGLSGLKEEDTKDFLWNFQKKLARVLAFLVEGDNLYNPLYIVQFNEDASYTCSSHHCLDSCEADYAIDYQLDEVQFNEESGQKGHIDAACSISKRSIDASRGTCGADIRNEMAIAVLNSDIRGLDEDSSSEEDSGYGACRAHFDTRYVVGTNSAKDKAMRKFSSQEFRTHYVSTQCLKITEKDSINIFQIHANKFSEAALDTFLSCTRLRCCDLGSPKRQTTDDTADDYEVPIWVAPIVSPGDCKKTTDEYGRMDANFPDHTGIGQSDQ